MSNRYPKAKHDVGGKMLVRGRYAAGFPRGAVVHFTAGGPNAENTVAGGIRNKYCFFTIGPDGEVYQNFELDSWGYHAGESFHQKLGSRVSQFLVGIELCNAGQLRQIDENRFRPWFNDPEYYRKHREPVPAGVPNPARDLRREEVRYAAREANREAGWYHSYTPEQEKALEQLLLWLKQQQPDIFQFEFVLGHDEVSPGRKNDPGGSLSMTMPAFRTRLAALHSGVGADAPTEIPAEPAVAPSQPEDDSSPDVGASWTRPKTAQIHFGRFLPNYIFRTPDGEFFLSARSADTSEDPRTMPFAAAREREGQFAVIKAAAVDDYLLECSLVEALPPISSMVLKRLLETNSELREQVLGVARQVRNELLGEEPALPTKDPLRVAPSGPKPVCVIDIGHQPSAAGAEGQLDGKTVTEFEFNSDLAKRIHPLVKDAEIVVISRDDTADGYEKLPALTNSYDPAFVISLHANANGPTATGSEVIYFHTSERGKKLAGLLQKEFLTALELRSRGLKGRAGNERGGSQLINTRAPIVIGEPFFINNEADLRTATRKKDALAAAYAAAIDAYAATLSQPAATATSKRVVESQVVPGKTFELVTEGLGKEKFFATNDAALTKVIAGVNATLGEKYGADFRPLTREDAWVLTYCEAGLDSNGNVNPDHRHSEGERGMLPLPQNIRDWNGSDAPVWNRPMPLARNLEHFYLYLGHLKNKKITTAGERTLYRDLFRVSGIMGDAVREANLLAGVVHGYFYSGTYRDHSVPFEELLAGYREGTGLAALMGGTTYKHAGTSILRGREKNINAALALA
jgi:N-acetylmuramoyl-L-alanine amidase/N-acetyl-anhydromuramyl-L-alanine amidase AmpD